MSTLSHLDLESYGQIVPPSVVRKTNR